MFQAEVYDLNDEEKVPVIKNWLGREGLQFIQPFTNTNNKACKRAKRVFNVFKQNSNHSIMK